MKKAQQLKKKHKKLNNAGMTLTEMIVTFALLALFMVAATRVISYIIGIYYAASGNSYGLQVSNMISNKIVGQIEGALPAVDPQVSSDGSGIDTISFMDETGSKITIGATPQMNAEGSMGKSYMNIHYDEVTEGSIKYDAVDWKFDSKAYLGYSVSGLKFEDPGSGFPKNVMKMTLVLNSERYGDYTSTYYIKCVNVEEILY